MADDSTSSDRSRTRSTRRRGSTPYTPEPTAVSTSTTIGSTRSDDSLGADTIAKPQLLDSDPALHEMEFEILLRLPADGVLASLAFSHEAAERAIFESSAEPIDDVRRLTRCQ